MSAPHLSESTCAHFTYTGVQLDQVSFPLGGIGSAEKELKR